MTNYGMPCFISIAIILTCISRARGVKPASVTISPQHVHFRDNGAQQKITCKAAAPNSMCEFRVYVFTNGNPTQFWKYEGEVLTTGECATTLLASQLQTDHYNMVTCRVRSANNDWAYASMSVYKSNKWAITLVNTAYDKVVLPGSRLNLAVRGLEQLLSKCSILSPPSNTWVTPFYTPTWNPYGCIDSSFYGDGQGPCEKTCGMFFDNVTEAHNGVFILTLESAYYKETTFVNVIVAKLPSVLTLDHEMVYNEDGSVILKATCTVRGSRPAPLITWTLDGEVVPDEAVTSVVADKWVSPHQEQNVTQIMTLNVTESLAGKEVRCAATHSTLNVALYNTFKIRSGFAGPTVQTGPPHATPNSSQMTDGGAKWLYVVIAVLASLLVILIISLIIYARHEKLLCFSPPKEKQGESVSYRRSLDASFKYEETCSPTTSSIDRYSAVTGMEYAEIRVSMVQRCVDKLEGNPNPGRPSAETGEVTDYASRPNSLYLSYDEKV